MAPGKERVRVPAMRCATWKIGLDESEFSPTLSGMTHPRRGMATRAMALVAAALTLLGVQLFLPSAAFACGPVMSDCCCAGEIPDPAAPASADGCDCSISQPTPVPAADVAPTSAFASPVLAAEAAEDLRPAGPAIASRHSAPPTRSRSAPTLAFLETFRN